VSEEEKIADFQDLVHLISYSKKERFAPGQGWNKFTKLICSKKPASKQAFENICREADFEIRVKRGFNLSMAEQQKQSIGKPFYIFKLQGKDNNEFRRTHFNSPKQKRSNLMNRKGSSAATSPETFKKFKKNPSEKKPISGIS